MSNWKNRTVWRGDNLDVMRGMNSGSVDLVYLDPPFNSNRNYAAPIGSEAAGAAFKDTWTLSDVDLAWHGEIADREPGIWSVIECAGTVHGKGMKSYLIMMAIRLLEIRRLLKPTGSLYLHCDPTAGAYLKVLLDGVMGRGAFRRELVWVMSGASGMKAAAPNWIRGHDTVLYYRMGDGSVFNRQFKPYKESTIRRYDKVDAEGKRYKIFNDKDGKQRIVYPKEGTAMTDTWEDIAQSQLSTSSPEWMGYPTQKPVALLERIIRASSNPGDIVMDPFCGCATTCVAAEKLGREWVGIDIEPMAAELIKRRLKKEVGTDGLLDSVVIRDDIPGRTDVEAVKHYREHKHVLFGEQEGRCTGCKIAFPFRNMTVDHIVPRSKGGQDNKENLQLLCGACNSLKGQGTQEQLIAKLKEVT